MFSPEQVVVAVLLVLAVYKPLPKWSPIAGWELKIDWRLPSLKSTKRFLIFAGPICFVLLTKVLMYSESSSSLVDLMNHSVQPHIEGAYAEYSTNVLS